MKKITGIMLVVVLAAVLSVSAFAANAPLTAAEFFANRTITEDASTGGTLQFSIVEPFLPAIGQEVGPVDAEEGDIVDFVDLDSNVFDVIVKQTEKFGFSGGKIELFFNPEIIAPVDTYQKTVYDLTLYDDFELTSTVLKSVTGNQFLTGFLMVTDGSSQSYDVAYADGETNYVSAKDSGIVANRAPNYELARWPFMITAADNNWYRTKLIGSYTSYNLSAEELLYPVVADGGVMYFENEAYTGPKFDIVGAMKRNDGELRFGSVYFSGVDAAHDNETVIVDAGVVLYPTRLLDDTTLTLDTTGAIKISANGYYDDSTDDIIYTGVLTGLAGYEDMYITARSYVKYNDGEKDVVVYSDPIARSLDWVGDNTDMQ
ncbi:MAG: hypothetical protein IJO52_07400 [Clostridia bacterium]|nr:hypothetical protein [Clostridia bacterium]